MSYDDPFELPRAPPQFDTEESAEILDLIMQSPQWDPSFGAELGHLLRAHVTLRSALGYAMELMSALSITLRTASTIEEVKMAQGAMNALDQFTTHLIDSIKDAERPKEIPQ